MACAPGDIGVRTGVPIVGADVDLPIEDIGCTRESEVGVGVVRIPAIPTVGCVEVPIDGTDDGALVGAPIGGVVEAKLLTVPTVERVVPVTADGVVPEAIGVADPVVPSEPSAGNIVAEGPIPSFAAKELKSDGAPNPRAASKASKSGSAPAGMTAAVAGGKLNAGVLGAVGAAVPMPPAPVVCPNATQGVAMSAAGAIHPMIRFIPPPCRTPTSGADRRACGSARRIGQEDYTVEELSKCFRPGYEAIVTAS